MLNYKLQEKKSRHTEKKNNSNRKNWVWHCRVL